MAERIENPPERRRPELRRSSVAGALIGVGVAGFVDETVFHQLLHWHHFYDKSTANVGLFSDGLFHAGSWLAIVAALFLFADLLVLLLAAAGPTCSPS